MEDSQLTEVMISVRGVSKRFEMYERPVDRLLQTLCAGSRQFFKEFWALKDINFEVRRGECVGIIGRNGAGKSTLLQIITGTLAATTGETFVRGRVAALLELGSGFNPEFTGRENVFLNGAILGFSRSEMQARFQGIADFADIGDFIDRPVKTYSSGMMVRLAFAVQVMASPDILIVDEALAVGDIGFQMRCFQKLKDLMARGTTILFVSHDMGTVSMYCQKVLFLENGRQIVYSNNVIGAINAYKESIRRTDKTRDFSEAVQEGVSEYRFGTHEATIEKLDVFDPVGDGENLSTILTGRRYCIGITIRSRKAFPKCVMGIALRNRAGMDVWTDNTLTAFPNGFELKPGDNRLVFETNFNANANEYGMTIGLADISVSPRVELDQRWPMRSLTVISQRHQHGTIYAPMDFVSQEP